MALEEVSKRRNLIALSICMALVQIALYYLVASTIRSDGSLAIVQPDTLLYCQAARRIAEGFPFSFSAGTGVSTGTTSVLYPFFLAVPYLIGFKGHSLIAAGFLLNSAFYIVFVVGWVLVACHAFAERPISRFVSSLLVSLFGPFAFCALAQSDIGLWMAVSAWLAFGLPGEGAYMCRLFSSHHGFVPREWLLCFPFWLSLSLICFASAELALMRWLQGYPCCL